MPFRRLITPSTRQCAGRGPMEGAPGYGGGTIVPAGMISAFVISTPLSLRRLTPPHSLDCCASAAASAQYETAASSRTLEYLICDYDDHNPMEAQCNCLEYRSY